MIYTLISYCKNFISDSAVLRHGDKGGWIVSTAHQNVHDGEYQLLLEHAPWDFFFQIKQH